MKSECAATVFHVGNLTLATTYYTETLGFTVDFQYNELTGLEYGSVLLYLSGPGQDLKKAVGQGSIYIFCDEVDQYYQSILNRGALLAVAIADRPYGMRDFAIRDHDGNTLTFGRSI